MTDYERFVSKFTVDLETSCWNWDGYINHAGYGMFRVGDKVGSAHRSSYEIFSGQVVPGDMHVDHLCRNKVCVNYLHTEVVTPGENQRRGMAALNKPKKTHCPYGHDYEGNAYLGKSGGRTCIICTKERNKLRKQELREQKMMGIEPTVIDKSHCQRGHLLTDANIYVKPSTGARECRPCRNMMRKKGYHRKIDALRELDR